MSTRGDNANRGSESILSMAWSSLRDRAGTRRTEPETGALETEYLAIGRRSNAIQIDARQDGGLFALVHANDVIEDLLEVPFVLTHLKDVHAAMQLAVASIGEDKEPLLGSGFFHPVFASLTLGFAIGLATEHRVRHMNGPSGDAALGAAETERCREWGLLTALYYLVNVEANGVIDRDTDRQIYGIADNWRLLGDHRRLQPFMTRLLRCVQSGKRAGQAWARQEGVEMGALLAHALGRTVATYPERTFQ